MLITGGWLVDPTDWSEQTTANAYLFDPATLSWETFPPMQQSRHLHYAAKLLDGRVLVTGGEFYEWLAGEDWEHGLLTTSELFDPTASAWVEAPKLPTHTFYSPVVGLPDGPVLLVGGEVVEETTDERTDHVQVFTPDAETGSWSETTKLPVTLNEHTAPLLPDGTVFVAGGRVDGGSATTATTY